MEVCCRVEVTGEVVVVVVEPGDRVLDLERKVSEATGLAGIEVKGVGGTLLERAELVAGTGETAFEVHPTEKTVAQAELNRLGVLDKSDALVKAVWNSDYDMASLCLQYFGTHNARLLHDACSNNDHRMAELLLSTSSTPPPPSVLCMCCRLGYTSLVKLLLAHGVDPNSTTVSNKGRITALDIAEPDSTIAELLVAAGAKHLPVGQQW